MAQCCDCVAALGLATAVGTGQYCGGTGSLTGRCHCCGGFLHIVAQCCDCVAALGLATAVVTGVDSGLAVGLTGCVNLCSGLLHVVGFGDGEVTAGVGTGMILAVVYIILLGAACVGAFCLDGDVALVGDFQSILSGSQHGIPCPVCRAVAQDGVEGGVADGDAAGETRALGLALGQGQGDGGTIVPDIIAAAADTAAADGYFAVRGGIHAVAIPAADTAADASAADGYFAVRVGKHAVGVAADGTAADGHGAAVGSHAVAAADAAAADRQFAAVDGHALYAADAAAFAGIGDGHIRTGAIHRQTVGSGAAELLAVQVKGEHAGANALIGAALVDTLQELHHSLVGFGGILHRGDGVRQSGVSRCHGAVLADGGHGIGMDRAADAQQGGLVVVVLFGGFLDTALGGAGVAVVLAQVRVCLGCMGFVALRQDGIADAAEDIRGAVVIVLVSRMVGADVADSGIGIAHAHVFVAGGVAIVDLIAAQGGVRIGADGLAPDIFRLLALEQVGHLAAGELRFGLCLCVGVDLIFRIPPAVEIKVVFLVPINIGKGGCIVVGILIAHDGAGSAAGGIVGGDVANVSRIGDVPILIATPALTHQAACIVAGHVGVDGRVFDLGILIPGGVMLSAEAACQAAHAAACGAGVGYVHGADHAADGAAVHRARNRAHMACGVHFDVTVQEQILDHAVIAGAEQTVVFGALGRAVIQIQGDGVAPTVEGAITFPDDGNPFRLGIIKDNIIQQYDTAADIPHTLPLGVPVEVRCVFDCIITYIAAVQAEAAVVLRSHKGCGFVVLAVGAAVVGADIVTIEIAIGGGIENFAAAGILIYRIACEGRQAGFQLPNTVGTAAVEQIGDLTGGKLAFLTDAAVCFGAGVGAYQAVAVGIAVIDRTHTVACGVCAVVACDIAVTGGACKNGAVCHVAVLDGSRIVAARDAACDIGAGIDGGFHNVAVFNGAAEVLTDDGAYTHIGCAVMVVGEALDTEIFHRTRHGAEQAVCPGFVRNGGHGKVLDHVSVAVEGAGVTGIIVTVA